MPRRPPDSSIAGRRLAALLSASEGSGTNGAPAARDMRATRDVPASHGAAAARDVPFSRDEATFDMPSRTASPADPFAGRPDWVPRRPAAAVPPPDEMHVPSESALVPDVATALALSVGPAAPAMPPAPARPTTTAVDGVREIHPDPPLAPQEPATARAMRAVRGAYVEQHGDPLDRAASRPRRRWAVTWRAAGAAAVALALVGGGVAVRAASLGAGPAVVLPVPSPEGTAASSCADACVTPTPAPSATGGLVVHVVGAVHEHGVVRLPAGSRVADAVEAAGGATKAADLDALNLARVLVDGEQIVVPRVGDPPTAPEPTRAAPTSTNGGTGVDLNTADAAALDALPGIGPVLAQRIVDRRTEHPFTSVDELEDVPGIGPALLARLSDLVHV